MAINMSSCANVCVYPFFGVIWSAFGFPILLLSRLLYFFIGLIHPMKHTLMGMYIGLSAYRKDNNTRYDAGSRPVGEYVSTYE